MAYRNGTYVAFHAGDTSDPTASDIKYYRTLMMWNENENVDFNLVDSHDKTAAVRDSSKRSTLEASLKTRLNNSKNMVLILTEETQKDTDWVPFEIRYAIDTCEIPLILAYPGQGSIRNPEALRPLWPSELSRRIDNDIAHAIHVPFLRTPIFDAISQFSHDRYPKGGGLGRYTDAAYQSWDIR